MPLPGGAPRRNSRHSVKGGAAIACLLLGVAFSAGCGGGDSPSATTASGSTTRVASEPGAGSGGASGGSSRSGSTEGKAKGPSATGKRHGPPVPQPTGKREPRPTAKQRAEATRADITLTSPSLSGQGVSVLTTAYTCDGRNTWPSLKWSGVPSGTAELALLLVNTRPVDGELFFDWALAGIGPATEAIESGALPSGAIVGRSTSGRVGYSLCPAHGTSETYFFTLYALPERLGVKRGFDPAALRAAALKSSHNAGLLPVSYSRN